MSITFITGPMFAGKTTRLFDELTKYIDAGGNKDDCLLIKHSFDTRYSNEYVISHDCKYCSYVKNIIMTDVNTDFAISLANYKWIGIDEGQFYNNLIGFCKIVSSHASIYISGLMSTSNQELFNPIRQLLPHVDNIVMLHASCALCKDKAIYTIKKNENGDEILIGGDDIYQSLCRKCYFNL